MYPEHLKDYNADRHINENEQQLPLDGLQLLAFNRFQFAFHFLKALT